MPMKKIVCIVGMIILVSCGGTKTYTEQEQQQYELLKALVESKQFKIQSNFARPMATAALTKVSNSGLLGPGNSASHIDISTSSNFLEIEGDSVKGYFPFFGEQQIGNYPGNNRQGIEFSGIAKEYTFTENDAKQFIHIHFKIEDKNRGREQYTVFITLFPNNRSVIQINSSHRSSIEYSGTLQQLRR